MVLAMVEYSEDNLPRRVVDGIDKFVQLLLLMLRERARLLVTTCEVDIHIRGHIGMAEREG
jgi:predicted ATP-dependent serine protease